MIRASGLALVILAVLSTLLAAQAQPAGSIHRIGWLGLNSPPNPFYDAFARGLRELGYVEGRNVVIESRWAEGKSERLAALAVDLVRLEPDVIVTAAQAATAAAKQATAAVPIVMVNVTDPVGQGFIASLARPGRNVTGLTYAADEAQTGKLLQLIKEAVPRLSRVAVLINAAYPQMPLKRRVMEEVAPTLDIDLQWVPVHGPDEIEKSFAAMVKNRAGALIVVGDPLIFAHRREVIALADRNRLPAMYMDRVSVEEGGLMSYGSDTKDTYRRAATYVDKILKGAKPGDLPVEQPTKFELIVNLKTAKALSLTIPPSLVQRADQVIE
jgi:putative ABC transport system substrate-binding protein